MPRRPPVRTLKKVFPLVLIGGLVLFYAWLIFAACEVRLPDPKNPLVFYSNQTRHDIKLTFYRAIDQAGESIYLSVYGISDPQILDVLAKKTLENVSVIVEYDPSASGNLKKTLPPQAFVYPLKTKGLMHKKILVIDHALVFLGSANLTSSSLRHHANLVLGLHNPALAAFLEAPDSNAFTFSANGQTGEFYMLPDPKSKGMARLMDAIGGAKKKIRIAMFTLTHPEITEALIQAQHRGVEVCVAVDYYTAKGASKKALSRMEEEGVKIILSHGRELLHHKWAWIDDEVLAMGSANWTKAAFSKNSDFLFFLSPLDPEQTHFFNNLWDIIESEAIPSIEMKKRT